MLRALLLLLVMLIPATAHAQEITKKPAILIADEVFIESDRTLVAQGNVEAFQDGARLQASSVRYNQADGSLIIEGPITLTEGDETLIFADAGQLDADLRNGLLTGARLILN